MIDPQGTWKEVNAKDISSIDLLRIMTEYNSMGLTLYVGTDSMLYNTYCTFSCIIAVHSNNLRIANYYFQKQKFEDEQFKKLQNKIFKEIELSINTAKFLKHNIVNANIEIHVDIGNTNKNATKYLVDSAKRWVRGMGFKVKIKPDSWASSVADWHTK